MPDHPPPLPASPSSPRRAGVVVWGHATSADRLAGLLEIGTRLRRLYADLHLVVTVDARKATLTSANGLREMDVVPLQDDTTGTARVFLTDWQPSLCLWTGGFLQPTLLAMAKERGVPLILLDADLSELSRPRRRWFSDPIRSSLAKFAKVLVSEAATAVSLQRMGALREALMVTSPMRGGTTPPPYADEDVAAVSALLVGRPVWLAVHVQMKEVDAMLTAQHSAVRLAHRMLLVLVMDETADHERLAHQLDQSGLRWANWQFGDPIEDTTQVLVNLDPEDIGLWYRLAPLTFVASSLIPSFHGRSPLPAAALGSAILYGPNIRSHLATYSSLANAGAARIVKDGETLGTAVVQLSAPDRAAAMALAGWQLVTEGAQLVDDVIALTSEILDHQDDPDARP